MIKGPKPGKVRPTYWSAHVLLAFAFAVVLTVGLLGLLQWRSNQARARWPQAPVRVLALRIVVAEVWETERFGTVAIYRAQANVRYSVDNRNYDRWLPVLDRSDNREFLQWEMDSLRSKRCSVHWKPNDPEVAFLPCV